MGREERKESVESEEEAKVRREKEKEIILDVFTEQWIEKLAEAIESVDDELFARELIRRPRGYSNDADLKAFAEAEDYKQKKRKGAPQQGTVPETQHLTANLDEAKQVQKRRRKAVLQRMNAEAKKQLPQDKPDERAQRAAVISAERRAAAARDELQPVDIDYKEALERAIRASKAERASGREILEDRQERERREKHHQAEASTSQITNSGKQEEDQEAIQRAMETSEAEAKRKLDPHETRPATRCAEEVLSHILKRAAMPEEFEYEGAFGDDGPVNLTNDLLL